MTNTPPKSGRSTPSDFIAERSSLLGSDQATERPPDDQTDRASGSDFVDYGTNNRTYQTLPTRLARSASVARKLDRKEKRKAKWQQLKTKARYYIPVSCVCWTVLSPRIFCPVALRFKLQKRTKETHHCSDVADHVRSRARLQVVAWLPDYSVRAFIGDLTAAVTVSSLFRVLLLYSSSRVHLLTLVCRLLASCPLADDLPPHPSKHLLLHQPRPLGSHLGSPRCFHPRHRLYVKPMSATLVPSHAPPLH